MNDQQEVWTAVAQLLRAQLTESVWFSTFHEVVPVVSDGEHNLVIQVPSTLARDRILTRYLPLITDALAELGEGDRRFDVVISSPEWTSHVSDTPMGAVEVVDELPEITDSVIDAAGGLVQDRGQGRCGTPGRDVGGGDAVDQQDVRAPTQPVDAVPEPRREREGQLRQRDDVDAGAMPGGQLGQAGVVQVATGQLVG